MIESSLISLYSWYTINRVVHHGQKFIIYRLYYTWNYFKMPQYLIISLESVSSSNYLYIYMHVCAWMNIYAYMYVYERVYKKNIYTCRVWMTVNTYIGE